MPKVRFIGSSDPTEDDVCTAFGETFEKNRWHKLTPELSKLAGNPMFEMADDKPAKTEAGGA